MPLFGLLGKKLSHSFSASYFNSKFQREQLHNYQYLNFELPTISELPSILEANPTLIGLNVTIPYKQEVIPYLDDCSPVAQAIGAVNTICIHRTPTSTRLVGHNTDTYGFTLSLTTALSHANHPVPPQALVLGTGGASKAVVYSLQQMGTTPHLVSRNHSDGIYRTYDTLTEEDILAHQLIVNTTPLGMYPNTDALPALPYQALTQDHILYDLIYNPKQTLFLQQGTQHNALTINGAEMLRLQAEKAWELWQTKP